MAETMLDCPNPACHDGEVDIPGVREAETGAPISVRCSVCAGEAQVTAEVARLYAEEQEAR